MPARASERPPRKTVLRSRNTRPTPERPRNSLPRAFSRAPSIRYNVTMTSTIARLPLLAALLIPTLSATTARAQQKEQPAYTTLDPDQFEKQLKEAKAADAVILDVRTPEEHKTAHLKDAVLIDYKARDFDQKIKALDKSKTYFVYCASGYRSSSACKKLQALDFPRLYNLKGGITAWQKAGKPTEK